MPDTQHHQITTCLNLICPALLYMQCIHDRPSLEGDKVKAHFLALAGSSPRYTAAGDVYICRDATHPLCLHLMQSYAHAGLQHIL